MEVAQASTDTELSVAANEPLAVRRWADDRACCRWFEDRYPDKVVRGFGLGASVPPKTDLLSELVLADQLVFYGVNDVPVGWLDGDHSIRERHTVLVREGTTLLDGNKPEVSFAEGRTWNLKYRPISRICSIRPEAAVPVAATTELSASATFDAGADYRQLDIAVNISSSMTNWAWHRQWASLLPPAQHSKRAAAGPAIFQDQLGDYWPTPWLSFSLDVLESDGIHVEAINSRVLLDSVACQMLQAEIPDSHATCIGCGEEILLSEFDFSSSGLDDEPEAWFCQCPACNRQHSWYMEDFRAMEMTVNPSPAFRASFEQAMSKGLPLQFSCSRKYLGWQYVRVKGVQMRRHLFDSARGSDVNTVTLPMGEKLHVRAGERIAANKPWVTVFPNLPKSWLNDASPLDVTRSIVNSESMMHGANVAQLMLAYFYVSARADAHSVIIPADWVPADSQCPVWDLFWDFSRLFRERKLTAVTGAIYWPVVRLPHWNDLAFPVGDMSFDARVKLTNVRKDRSFFGTVAGKVGIGPAKQLTTRYKPTEIAWALNRPDQLRMLLSNVEPPAPPPAVRVTVNQPTVTRFSDAVREAANRRSPKKEGIVKRILHKVWK